MTLLAKTLWILWTRKKNYLLTLSDNYSFLSNFFQFFIGRSEKLSIPITLKKIEFSFLVEQICKNMKSKEDFGSSHFCYSGQKGNSITPTRTLITSPL